MSDWTTIAIERIDKEELARIKGELMQSLGDTVDFGEAVKFLLILFSVVKERNPELVIKAIEEFRKQL